MNEPARLNHHNRARLIVRSSGDVAALGIFSDKLSFLKDLFEALGPIRIDTYRRTFSDGQTEDLSSIGFEAGLSTARIKQLMSVVRTFGTQSP